MRPALLLATLLGILTFATSTASANGDSLVAGMAQPIVIPQSPSITNCAGGEIYDDGVAENGYSGNPALITDFQAMQQFTPSAFPASYDTVCLSLTTLAGNDLSFVIEVRDDDGVGGEPGTLLGSVAVSENTLPSGLPCSAYEFDISSMGLNIPSGSVFIGVRWDPSAFPSRFICSDETPATPQNPGFVNFNNPSLWQSTQDVFPGYRALLLRAMPTPVAAPEALPIPVFGLWGAFALISMVAGLGFGVLRRKGSN